jgi:hypothetical protein
MVRAPVFAGVRRDATAAWRLAPVYSYTALVIAALHVIAGQWAADFSRPLQLFYIAILALPAILIWGGEQRARPATDTGVEDGSDRPSSRSLLAVMVVLAAWVVWRAPMTWRSLRGIDFIDADLPFERLVNFVSGSLNLVVGDGRQSSVYLLFQGAGLLPADVLLNWGWLQLASMLWVLASAIGVAYLGSRLIGCWAAPVATAAFLFSPFVLSIPLSIVPLFTGPLFVTALLVLVLVIERERRPSAIVALGALAGGAALVPPITPAAVVVGVWVVVSLSIHSPRPPFVLLAIATLSFLAATIPSLPSLAQLQGMAKDFASARVQWAGLEAWLFGQLSAAGGEFAISPAAPTPIDLPLSAFLSPFAAPRTAVRLWGDAIFDPIGAGLAAVGLLATLRRLHTDRIAGLLWLVLVVALLTVVPSSYDRPSLARLVTAPVVMALWTAAGFEVVRRGLAGSRSGAAAAAVVSAAIAVGGGVLFDYINPVILARSALGISLTALERTPVSQAVIFARKGWDPQRSAMFASLVPAEERAVLPYDGPTTLEAVDRASVPRILLWAPALEQEANVALAVCGRWPGAALYTLYDRPHLSRAFAASPRGRDWRPALPPSQWTVAGCEAQLETEGSRSAAALAAAEKLFTAGRHAEAIVVLRQTARQSFVQAQLFETLARAILEHSPQTDLNEAIYWARRATEAGRQQGPRAFATLASAYAAQGRYGEAAAAAARAEEVARVRQDEAMAREMKEKRESYERQRPTPGQ